MVDHLPCEPLAQSSVMDAPIADISTDSPVYVAMARGMSIITANGTLTMVSDGTIRRLSVGLWIDHDGGWIYDITAGA